MKKAAVPSILVVVILLALGVMAEAQQPTGKIARIAYLGSDRAPAGMPRESAFFQGLREHGWIEGQNIMVERRYWTIAPSCSRPSPTRSLVLNPTSSWRVAVPQP